MAVRRTITDVIAVVRVGESTIKRRLTEFADTETGDITVEEFSQMIEKQADPLELEVLVCACLSLPLAISLELPTLLLFVGTRIPVYPSVQHFHPGVEAGCRVLRLAAGHSVAQGDHWSYRSQKLRPLREFDPDLR